MIEFDPKQHLYFIKGDSPRIVSDAEATLLAQAKERGLSEVVIADGAVADGVEITNALSQTYMFSSAAIVCLREVDLMNTERLEPLLNYLGTAFASDALDNYLIVSSFSGTVSPKLSKLVTANGILLDLKMADNGARKDFLHEELRQSALQFRPDAVSLISKHFGDDVTRVRSMIEVLESCFDSGAQLSAGDVELYLNRPGQRPLYGLTNDIEACSPGGEGAILAELETFLGDLAVHPLAIFTVLSRRIIEVACIQSDEITSADQVNARLVELGLKKKAPFAARKLLDASQALGFAGVKKAIVWCAEAEARLKGVGGIPPEFAIELLVARLANLYSRRRIVSKPAGSRY